MNLSYNWLSKYLDLNDLSVTAVANELTLAGLEVEKITHLAKADHLVVGKVLEVKNHPNADALKVCQVDIGSEVLQIVCGAPNVEQDQKVIVAKVGATLPELKIKETTIRDVSSKGMICSLSELGVSEKNLSNEQIAGIEVLNQQAIVGSENVLEALGLDDAILEIDLTPNRTDCLAMFNMAKEVGAILDRKVVLPTINDHHQGLPTKVTVGLETKYSERIGAKLIGDITIKPSVAWMKEILISNGIKPINNVVDISNIVMLELGQPLHFYDADNLNALELVVKDGYSQKFIALDEEEYTIKPSDLVITSNNEVIGIAGLMGGENSKITDKTKSILIESAHFDLTTIRISSRELNITSEASQRFSKGIDPNALEMAINRAVDLLIKYADATKIEETVIAGEQNLTKKRIVTTSKYINDRLGTNYTAHEMETVFKRLDFNPVLIDNTISVHIPTYRQDIEEEVDLSEEVIRIIGVDKLESTLPYIRMSPGGVSESDKQQQELVQTLRGGGFNEAITYSLVSKENLELAVMPIGKAVKISNPISKDRMYYRTSLIPSMLEVIHYNEARNNTEYSLYEIASVYSDDNLSQERLSIAISSKQEISAWQNIVNFTNFFSVKGRVEALLLKLGIKNDRVEVRKNSEETTIFHPYQSGQIFIDDKLFGVMGLIHPKIQKNYDITQAVIGEFNLEVIYQARKSKVKYTDIPKFPGVNRDIAVIVQEDLKAADLIDTVLKVGKSLVVDAKVFDVYQGENIEEGYKSIALRVYYQSLEKTLKDEDVNDLHASIVQALRDRYDLIYREK
ncbi:MAG: phenylalanine--tRNA ligase subunit beta [Erysipelothrix sp.]|nr:phenylalanine--tRNA ligase subunit beta [Erysipelothrix sp.]